MTSAPDTIVLWKGMETDFYPNPVFLDALIGKRIRNRGFGGGRSKGKCTFASTNRAQAENYADTAKELRHVIPAAGATITWAHNTGDLILEFENFLRDLQWGTLHVRWPLKSIQTLLDDVQGDISTLEVYLSENRMKRAITVIVDRFLDNLDIREVTCDEHGKYDLLREHAGEVWITGPCELRAVA